MSYPQVFAWPLMAFAPWRCVRQPAAPAAANFDGQWSVVIITEAGNCDRAYRYPVKVMNGEMKYEGEAGITLTGRIDASGRCQRNGPARRTERHRFGPAVFCLRARDLDGQIRTTACNGRWEAEKRAG